MILGAIANIAGYATSAKVIKGLTTCLESKTVVDKVLIPVGTFIISSMIGDACQEYAEKKVNEVKETVDAIKNIRDAVKESDNSDEKITEMKRVNIFEEEGDDNGGSENA